MNMHLIITEVKYGAIDANDSSCHSYYIIKFSLYPYTLQADLIIDGQVISCGQMLCEGNYFFPLNINYHYYFLRKTKSNNTVFFLRKIINGNGNILCFDYKDVISPCLRYISHNYYNTLSPIHIPMK